MKLKVLIAGLVLLTTIPLANAEERGGRFRDSIRARIDRNGTGNATANATTGARVSGSQSQGGGESSQLNFSVERNLTYGKETLQDLDVFFPETVTSTSRLPVLIFVHGGGWRIGDKKPHAVKGMAYAKRGIIFANINYRLVPQAMHPEQVKDIARAIKYVQANSAKWGGDPDRIYLMGHSAGAHLVDLVATNQKFLNELGVDPTCLAGVISLDTASLDLLQRIKDDSPELNKGGAMIENAFGKNPANLKDGSPTLTIKAGTKSPPFLMFCGARRMDAVSQHDVFSKKLLSVGGKCLIKPVPLTHRDISLNAGDASSQIFKDVNKFIENTKP
ncbi:MAG: alpha/beta hydrolase [Leptolyngbya sp.]|nr:alpha/beta hydrolase [Candidatus Melainabacteria bacterium]